MITLIDFFADWCAPCQALKPILLKVEESLNGKLIVDRVNVDLDSARASKFNIMSIPTLVILKDGVEVDRKMGLLSEQSLRQWLEAYLK